MTTPTEPNVERPAESTGPGAQPSPLPVERPVMPACWYAVPDLPDGLIYLATA